MEILEELIRENILLLEAIMAIAEEQHIQDTRLKIVESVLVQICRHAEGVPPPQIQRWMRIILDRDAEYNRKQQEAKS